MEAQVITAENHELVTGELTQESVIELTLPGTLERPIHRMRIKHFSRADEVVGTMAHDCTNILVHSGVEWVPVGSI